MKPRGTQSGLVSNYQQALTEEVRVLFHRVGELNSAGNLYNLTQMEQDYL